MAQTSTALLCEVDGNNAAMGSILQQYNVSGVPCLVYIKGEKEVDRMVGVDSAKLAKWVKGE